jgi:hypothetical protein
MGILGICLRYRLSGFQVYRISRAMIRFLKNAIQRCQAAFVQYRQFGMNTEGEDLAMSCGAFNPRFLAKIKRSKASRCVKPETHAGDNPGDNH